MNTIKKMYDHLNWANKRILQAIENQDEKNQQAIRLFAHILHSEQVWLSRLHGIDSTSLPIWPDSDITVCAQLVEQNNENFKTYIANLTSAAADDLITYKNQSKKEFRTSIRDILTHVALHGQYHRGQINAMLRIGGSEPVNVDFITFVR